MINARILFGTDMNYRWMLMGSTSKFRWETTLEELLFHGIPWFMCYSDYCCAQVIRV